MRKRPSATPEALSNLAPMNLDGNRASISEAIDAGLLSGAVTLVWQAGEVLQVNELGYRDVEARLPMQRDTMFRIASMTKPVTVAAAMTLVDEGRLALDRSGGEMAAGAVRTAGDVATSTARWTTRVPPSGRSPSTT